MYIHQQPDWPRLHWNTESLADRLAEVRYKQGHPLGRTANMGFSPSQEAHLQALTKEIISTHEIEGETLDARATRSSIARRLGMDEGGPDRTDRKSEGAAEITMDATRNYAETLTKERLCGWHTALFPNGHSGTRKIRAGESRQDRTGPMQVVSGPVGRERVHHEAPPAEDAGHEMKIFPEWLNKPDKTDPVIRAGISHPWFITIHPFEDGNGRMARNKPARA